MSLRSLSEGLIDSESSIPSPCENLVQAKFTVTVTRCVPVPDSRGNPPSPDQIMDSADQISEDAYLLAKSACMFDMYGSDGAPGTPLGGMGVDWTLTVNDPEGGVQSVVLEVTTVIG